MVKRDGYEVRIISFAGWAHYRVPAYLRFRRPGGGRVDGHAPVSRPASQPVAAPGTEPHPDQGCVIRAEKRGDAGECSGRDGRCGNQTCDRNNARVDRDEFDLPARKATKATSTTRASGYLFRIASRWFCVLNRSVPSEIAGVAMQTSPSEFFARISCSGPALTT